MTIIKRRYITRRHRTKTRLFASSFRGAHSRLTRTTQQKIRAFVLSNQDRVREKNRFLPFMDCLNKCSSLRQ